MLSLDAVHRREGRCSLRHATCTVALLLLSGSQIRAEPRLDGVAAINPLKTVSLKVTDARSHSLAEELALHDAVLSFQSGDYAGALEHLERADSTNPTVAKYRALCHLERRDYRQMVLAACAIVQPTHGPELTTGMNHLADGQLAAAAEALSAYLQTSPNDQVAQLVLGQVLVEQGNLRGAQARLAAAASDASLAPFAEQLLGPAELPQPAIDGGGVPSPCEACDECTGYDPWFDPERRWNFTVLTGYQYDSNVVLAPEFVGLGAATNRDDSSWFVASFGDYRLIQEPDLNVGLIMSTFDNFYFEQNDFDLQDYMLGAYANRAVNECWLAGIRFEFHETLLDYDHFANEFRLVPNLTYLQGDFGHFTSYYEFDAGQFDILPLVPAQDRDARVNAVGFTQAIYTFAGLGRWFFGYRYEDAEADGDDFDRSTHMATARFERPICERWVMDGEVRQFWDDYDDPNSLDFFGNERSDQRTEVRWGLQWYLSRHASLRLDYTFINSNSNVANLFGVRFFEYDRHLVAPQFIYDF